MSIVCGWTLHTASRRSFRYRFSWPFGRAELDAERVVLSVRGPLGKLFEIATRFERPRLPVVIPLATVRSAELIRPPRSRIRAVRLRCLDPEIDGISVGAFRHSFDRLLEGLRGFDVPIGPRR